MTLDSATRVTTPQTTVVGFTDDHHVEQSALGGGGWRVAIEGDRGTVLTAATTAASSTVAYARGLRVSGYSASLALRDDTGAVAYVGHRELYPTSGSLAPDGSAVAWTTSGGAVVVQRFDDAADRRVKGVNDWFSSTAIVDETHVLVGRNNGQLALLDVTTGEELGAVQGQVGAIVVDGATGEAVAAGDGWIFERTTELPTTSPQNVERGFDVDF